MRDAIVTLLSRVLVAVALVASPMTTATKKPPWRSVMTVSMTGMMMMEMMEMVISCHEHCVAAAFLLRLCFASAAFL